MPAGRGDNLMNHSATVTAGGRAARRQVLAGALIISFSSIFVRLAHVGPTTAGFYRMLFGSLVLLAAAGLWRHRLWVGWRAACAAGMAGGLFFLVIWDMLIFGRTTSGAEAAGAALALAAIYLGSTSRRVSPAGH